MKRLLVSLSGISHNNAQSVLSLCANRDDSAQALLSGVNKTLAHLLCLEESVGLNVGGVIPALSNFYQDDKSVEYAFSACNGVVSMIEDLLRSHTISSDDILKLKTHVMIMVAQIERLLVKCNYCRIVDHMAIERHFQKLKSGN